MNDPVDFAHTMFPSQPIGEEATRTEDEFGTLDHRIGSIEQKLDIILAEVRDQQRHRREMEALKEDLMFVGRDLYQSAIVELDSIHESFRVVDVLHLGKKLLRNIDVMTRSLEKLESVKDFVEDAGPLARDAFNNILQALDDLDRKGWFLRLRDSHAALREADIPQEPSLFHLMKMMREPDVRRGVGFLLAILGQIGRLTDQSKQPSSPTQGIHHEQ